MSYFTPKLIKAHRESIKKRGGKEVQQQWSERYVEIEEEFGGGGGTIKVLRMNFGGSWDGWRAEEEFGGEVERLGGHHSAHSCLVVVMDSLTAGIRGRNRRELLFAVTETHMVLPTMVM